MQTAVISGPGQMELKQLPVPEAKPGWIVARVRAAGVCQTDIEILEGTLPHLKTGLSKYPMVPGHEWAGEVTAVGESVGGFKPGDRVTGETHVGCGECEACRTGFYVACESMLRVGIGGINGAISEYVTLPAKSVHHLPDELDFVTAATLEPATVAYYAIYKCNMKGGENVVVVGPGAIGLLATGIARGLGAGRVTLIGTRDYRLEIGRKMGAHRTINIRTNPEEVVSLAGTVDVLVDAAGSSDFFSQEIAMLRKGGVMAMAGFFMGPVPGVDLNTLVTRNLTLVGSLGSPGVWERVMAMVAGGAFDTKPVITHRFPLSQAVEAFHAASDRSSGAIKVIIEP